MNDQELQHALKEANALVKQARKLRFKAGIIRERISEELAPRHELEEIDIGVQKCKDSSIGVCYYGAEPPFNCLVCRDEDPDEKEQKLIAAPVVSETEREDKHGTQEKTS